MNTLVPAHVAERYPAARTVVFSTGLVYPLAAVGSRGSHEDDALGPPGDYANSCVGRERVSTFLAKRHQTPAIMYRLSYAIDLRYGVLCDVATKVARGLPVDVTMAAANVIWQGDANARAIQCLAHATSPRTAVNVTGLQPISIRWLAEQFGERLGCAPLITGSETTSAWLFDARRSYDWFGPPVVGIEEMIDAQAEWVRHGNATLGKPTHFGVRRWPVLMFGRLSPRDARFQRTRSPSPRPDGSTSGGNDVLIAHCRAVADVKSVRPRGQCIVPCSTPRTAEPSAAAIFHSTE